MKTVLWKELREIACWAQLGIHGQSPWYGEAPRRGAKSAIHRVFSYSCPCSCPCPILFRRKLPVLLVFAGRAIGRGFMKR